MKSIRSIVAIGLVTTVLSLAGCSSTPATTSAAGNGSETTSALGSQARALGEKAQGAASQALDITQNFLSGLTGQEITAETFQKGWEDLKAQLQTMYENAASEEAKTKIQETITTLETRFNEITASINSNTGVQDITKAVTDFFNEALRRINELGAQK